MPGSLRMIAVLLLVTMTAALPGAQALGFPAMEASHPAAGCHSHGPATPSPAPTSYQCCVSGHDVAIPNVSFSSRPLASRLCGLAADKQLCLGFAPDRHSVMFVLPADSPPGAAPLRI
jgi:hypothetical protein